jgi:hypothetical protein
MELPVISKIHAHLCWQSIQNCHQQKQQHWQLSLYLPWALVSCLANVVFSENSAKMELPVISKIDAK